jgi:hypothetical protein
MIRRKEVTKRMSALFVLRTNNFHSPLLLFFCSSNLSLIWLTRVGADAAWAIEIGAWFEDRHWASAKVKA